MPFSLYRSSPFPLISLLELNIHLCLLLFTLLFLKSESYEETDILGPPCFQQNWENSYITCLPLGSATCSVGSGC